MIPDLLLLQSLLHPGQNLGGHSLIDSCSIDRTQKFQIPSLPATNVLLFNTHFGFYIIPKMVIVNISNFPQMTLVDVLNCSITHFLFSNLLIYHLIGTVIHEIIHLYFFPFLVVRLITIHSTAQCFDY